MSDFTNGEFAENISRVNLLLTASRRLAEPGIGNMDLAKEVLRAAVVFLHSSLEEVIRSLYVHRLPNVSAENLNVIPFAAHEPSHRAKNIQLGDLLNHRGKFVENIIFESIGRYVDTLNINNSSQLVSCLKLAEVPHEPMRPFYEAIDALMKRRHQIVHQMDRSNELDPLASSLNDIDEALVEIWKSAVEGFTDTLMNEPALNTANT